MRELPTVRALAKARPGKVLKLWEGLGYYSRSRNLHQAARMIVDKHEGRFPESFEEVWALPGIGRYTAGAVCSIAFNQPVPIVDGNVIRVLTRVFGMRGHPRRRRTNRRLWTLAEQLVSAAALASPGRPGCSCAFSMGSTGDPPDGTAVAPDRNQAIPWLRRSAPIPLGEPPSGAGGSPALPTQNKYGCSQPGGAAAAASPAKPKTKDRSCSSLNQALMELGATVCTPRQPRCTECPLRAHCFAYLESQIDRFPNLGTRTATAPRRFVAFVIRNGARLLVRQRPEGAVNAGFWEFPNIEVRAAEAEPASAAARLFGRRLKNFRPLGQIRHSITRYRITMEVFEITARDFFWRNGVGPTGRPDARARRIGGRKGPSADSVAPNHSPRAALSELGQMRWAGVSELKKLPLAAAHRKVLNALLRGRRERSSVQLSFQKTFERPGFIGVWSVEGC